MGFEEITVLQLSRETEQLARRVAARVGRKPEDIIRTAAVEREAKALGVAAEPVRKRMTAAEMLALGRTVAAMPVLDPRSPKEIADDLNEP